MLFPGEVVSAHRGREAPAQRDRGTSLHTLETTTETLEVATIPFLLLQTPSSGSGTCRCWAAGSSTTRCSTLVGLLSSTSLLRGSAFLMTPFLGWSPSMSASWRRWLRSGGSREGAKVGGSNRGIEKGMGIEWRMVPIIYPKNDLRDWVLV